MVEAEAEAAPNSERVKLSTVEPNNFVIKDGMDHLYRYWDRFPRLNEPNKIRQISF